MYYTGTASVVITPESPMWLAGFAVRAKPSKGRLTDLHANALALPFREAVEPRVCEAVERLVTNTGESTP